VNVLVVNAGSSSLKLRLVDDGDGVLASTDIERWEGEDDTEELASFLDGCGDAAIDAVAHRVVHGSTEFRGPVLVDDEVEARVLALTDLAPLHQPRAFAGMRAMRSLRPELVEVACFDTSFHASLPAAASTYAVPAAWRTRWPVQRFGFHGLSHAYAARRGAALAGLDVGSARIVTCHLGAGASLCAVLDGRSVDTTMGFTPLEGLVMVTRSGTVDPGLVLWLIEHAGLSAHEVRDALEHRSGLAGLSGIASGDLRDVLEARAAGDTDAALAFDVYVHRLVQSIAAMTAALGGLDLLVFTGGVGEHSTDVRAAAAARLAYLGVAVDDAADGSASGDADITAGGAPVRTVVVTAREDLEIARQARDLLAAPIPRSGR
jgi:acetate kinase